MQIYRWYHQPSLSNLQSVSGPGRIQPVRHTIRYRNKEEEEEQRRDQEEQFRRWSYKLGYEDKGRKLDIYI